MISVFKILNTSDEVSNRDKPNVYINSNGTKQTKT